jgi:hypothetical protein
MKTPHTELLETDQKYIENMRQLHGRQRDELLLKCKQTIENLHLEIIKQKQLNSDMDT